MSLGRDAHVTTAPHRGATRRFWLLLLAFTVVGLVLRVGFVMAHQDPTDSPLLISGDGAEYHMLAVNVADGNGFVSGFNGAESGRPPAWPLLLSVVSENRGIDAMFRQQVVAAVVGAATVLLVGLAGRRINGERTGLVAAAVAAVYPGFWVYEWPLLSETLLLPGIALMLLLAYRFRDRPTLLRAIGLGALCGALALVRSEQVLVGLFVIAPLVLLARDLTWAKRAAWLAAAGVAAVLVISPWVIHNNGRFEEPVYLSTGLGNTLLAGNCPGTYEGELYGHYDIRCNYFLPVPADADPSEVDPIRREAAVDFMSDHLGELPLVALAREGRVFGVFRFVQTTVLWSEWSNVPLWVVQTWIVASWVLLAAAVYGTIALRRKRTPVYPLMGFVAITVLAIGATIGEVRYRAGLEVPLVILAAVAVDELWRRFRSSRHAGEDAAEELRADEAPDLLGVGQVPHAG
jgi:4-amino-4-deoxy-L-arabinose transferase-like glycosyltransferase